MRTISSIRALRDRIAGFRRQGKRIGFVPTMGALHDGHLSLIRRCRKENDIVVVSIFVNPIQFGPREDFAAYPRSRARDSRLAEECGCDILFCPSPSRMYPAGFMTSVDVPDLSKGLCGASRPGHFQGVATVVAKLFHIVMPDTAYFGQKDFQQVAVVRKMAADLNIPVVIRALPTVREDDGLAMSSRNRYLSADERQRAAVLFRSLSAARRKIREGERRPAAAIKEMRRLITEAGGVIDYIVCADAKTLQPLSRFQGTCVIALAVFFGKARLIDNIVLQI